MENATSLVNQFNLSKGEIQRFADKVAGEIEAGQYNALQVAINLKAMEEAVKQIKERIQVDIDLEAGKYAEKTIPFSGAEIEKKQRATYDFSQDQQWLEIRDKLKEREKMLKSLSGEMADPETGEIIRPAIQKVTPYYAIRLPR